MGRLIAVILFVAVLVPGVLLGRAWWLAAGRRAVADGSVELAEPTPEGTLALQRQAQHGRRLRRFGLLLGIAGVVASVVLFAEASVFLWLPVLVVGLLAGVLLAEDTRPRPRWKTAVPVRRPHQGEQISAWLLWTMRAIAVGALALAVGLWRSADLPDGVTVPAIAVPAVGWLLAEVALLRALLRPLPAAGADLPVDEALRTWSAHLVTAAATVLSLFPLGALLLTAGVDSDRVSEGLDLLPVVLVAGGLSALAAGLAVAFFLVTWLRPVRANAPALAG